jgi:hypothetical protein
MFTFFSTENPKIPNTLDINFEPDSEPDSDSDDDDDDDNIKPTIAKKVIFNFTYNKNKIIEKFEINQDSIYMSIIDEELDNEYNKYNEYNEYNKKKNKNITPPCYPVHFKNYYFENIYNNLLKDCKKKKEYSINELNEIIMVNLNRYYTENGCTPLSNLNAIIKRINDSLEKYAKTIKICYISKFVEKKKNIINEIMINNDEEVSKGGNLHRKSKRKSRNKCKKISRCRRSKRSR